MNADLVKSYDDGFNVVSNVFLDIPGIMTGVNDMFFKSNSATGQWNVDWYEGQAGNDNREKTLIFKNNFVNSYHTARNAYDQNFDNYKMVSRTSDSTTLENLIAQTYESTKFISDAIKNANNYIDFVNDSIRENNFETPALITTHKATLNEYTTQANTHLLSLLSVKTNIKNYKDSFLSADLDIQSAELSLKQKTNALQDAKDKLADYFIRAPFEGTITKINIKKSDTVSSGTVVTTLITKKQLAEISLNEVDVARIKIGQKATLSFDAVSGLTISGVVVDIDAVGTVAQGVVTYIIKVSFDTQDDRIKPGMSVSAIIITELKEGVLAISNGAIKSQKGASYVESFEAPLPVPTDGSIGSISKITPIKIKVEIGLSGDSESEIISGIKEGDEIIIRTILPTAATTTATSTPSLFGNTGGNRNAGSGNVRIQAR
ncbi:MAG: HlyD family efflux transporter periplasmic adaptor subunit [bacterium]|nr:HlyD family efflux transporter periplasmic adaptor subunit [bacterium]